MNKKEKERHPGSYQVGEGSDESLEVDSATLKSPDGIKDYICGRLLHTLFAFLYRHRTLVLIGILTIFSASFIVIYYSLSQTIKSLVEHNEYQVTTFNEVTAMKAELQASIREAEASSSAQQAAQSQLSQAMNAVLKSSLALQFQSQSQPQSQPQTQPNAALVQVNSSCPARDLYTIGMKYGTDKVTTHIYHYTYQRYFEPVRCQPLKFLEIGLGCDMAYGPGASFYVWLDYFPTAEIYFIEYDAACAKTWEHVNDRVRIFAGDQANVTFLQEFIAETGGEFDFIIDDGGHSMEQQITSFEGLMPALKSEGVYFIEDLLTSYIPMYGGGNSVENTTVNYIKDVMNDVMSRRQELAPNKRPISNSVSRIDCMDEICAFTKNNNERKKAS